MIRLFVSDLDGTLLNEKHVLSEDNRKAILEMREQGISFMPASGRDYNSVLEAIKDLEIHPKCICLNGAEFYDNDGKLLADYPITEKSAREVIAMVKPYALEVIYFCDDGLYSQTSPKALYELFMSCIMKYTGNGDGFDEEDSFFSTLKHEPDIEEIFKHDIMKIEVMLPVEGVKEKLFKELRSIPEIEITSAHEFNLEINSNQATKGAMVAKVCEVYGYDRDEVAVIGDGTNDISMFKLFKNSYVMDQARDDVKKYATYVAKSNGKDGVAKVIYEILEDMQKSE